MKKAKIVVEEQVTLSNEFTFDVPKDMSKEDIKEKINIAEQSSKVSVEPTKDFLYYLEQEGIFIEGRSDNNVDIYNAESGSMSVEQVKLYEENAIFLVVTAKSTFKTNDKSILLEKYAQIGLQDGYPVLKGLVGPMFESGNTVRYESPEMNDILSR